jgi:RecB family endonuclease NucS
MQNPGILPVEDLYQALYSGYTIVMYVKCEYGYAKHLRNSTPVRSDSEDLRLIIIKPDGSIQVHGGKYARPEVQLPRNSRIEFHGNEIVAENKERKLWITINEVYWIEYPRLGGGLMRRELTHNDIVNFVRSYPRLFLDCDNVIIGAEDLFDELYKRLRGVGRPDLIAYGCGRLYVIEVKTEQVNMDDVSQLKRYVDGMKQYIGDVKEVVGILVGESFSENAERMAENYNFRIVEYPRLIAYVQVKELLGP